MSKEILNLGHIFAFAGLIFLLLAISERFSKQTVLSQLLLAAGLSLIIGLIIEYLQTFVGRTLSWRDVWMDLVGALCAISFFSPVVCDINLKLRSGLRFAVILLTFLVTYPSLIIFVDEFIARKQFPVLADFTTPFEETRWSATMATIQLEQPEISTNKTLAVEFRPAKYSNVTLEHFPADWSKYAVLHMKLYNPEVIPVRIAIRIHDLVHTQGQQLYSDRFTQQLALNSGWNEIQIDLDEVIKAPLTRNMDMQAIYALMLFTSDLVKSRKVYVARVDLRN